MWSTTSNPRTLALLFMVGCGFSSNGSGGPIDAPPIDAIDARPIDVPDGARTDWWDASWSHRRLITIDTTKLPAALTGYPLLGFPVLVKLTSSTIDYATVKDDGSDLRFVLPDHTTVLPYELDKYQDGGTSLIWVRLPSLAANVAQQLYVYHGNTGAPAATNGAAVFADSHVSVHHLGADYADVTGHGHTGTPSGNPATVALGQIGAARGFNGTTDYISLAGESAYDFTNMLTASVWIQVGNFSQPYQAIITKGDDTWRIARENATNHLGFGDTSGGTGSGNDNLEGTTNVDNNQWHHAAIVYDGTKKLLYVDGQQDATRNYNLMIDKNNLLVDIGRNSMSQMGGQRFWDGNMDEVRISMMPRAPAWIRAEHVTVTDTGFVTIGADEPY